MKRNRLIMAIPMLDKVDAEFVERTILALLQTWAFRGHGYVTSIGNLTHHARWELVDTALKMDGWDYLVFVDSDMEVPRAAVDYCESYTDPVVGGLYYGRNFRNPRPVPGNFDPNDSTYWRMSTDQLVKIKEKPGLHPVDVLGFGFCAIRRDVFAQLPEPWFAHPPASNGRETIGEDVYFFRKVKAAGIQPFVDTRYTVRHLGKLYYDDASYAWWLQQQAGVDVTT